MSYTLSYGPNICANIVVQDSESNTVGNVIFPGRNFSGYGSPVDQNFLSMVENFASSNGGPSDPVTGQLWYDPGSNIANAISNVFDNASLKFNSANTSGLSNISPVWWRIIHATSAGVNLGEVGNVIIGNTSANYISLDATTGNIFTNGNIVVTAPGIFTIQPDGDIITDGNILANGYITSNSNITGANILTSGTVTAANIVSNGNITGGNLAISSLATIGGNVVIQGNLSVVGNTTFIGGNSNLSTDDTIIVLAANTTGPDTYDRGVEMKYWNGAVTNAFMGWDLSNGEFAFASSADLSTGTATSIVYGNMRADSINVANANFAGNVLPTANLTYDLGTPTLRWKDIYGGNMSLSGNLTVAGNISGTITSATISAPGGAGSNTQILFNDAGLVAGNTSFTFTKTNGDVNIPGNIAVAGSVNGTISVANAAQPNITSVGTLTSLSVTTNATVGGNVFTTRISTGAIGTAGTITGQWTLVGASTLEATYADLAERHHSDGDYPVGTVVTAGGSNEITPCTEGKSVVGVISNSYAYLMNGGAGDANTHPAVAYVGRVKVRVTGAIKKFDRVGPTYGGVARSYNVEHDNQTHTFGWSLESNTDPGEKLVLCIIK